MGYLIDLGAGFAGYTGGVIGAEAGPIGAGVGYLGANILVTAAGDRAAAELNKKNKIFGEWP